MNIAKQVFATACAFALAMATSVWGGSRDVDHIYSAAEVAAMASNGAPIAVQGMGISTCTEFAEMYRENPSVNELFYFNWAQGLMSGFNMERLREGLPVVDLSQKPIEDQKSTVRTYCDDHPLGRYEDAVVVLYRSML